MPSSPRHATASSDRPPSRSPRFPSFAVDPAAWFQRIDELLEVEPERVLAARPATWIDPSGHRWRVVSTSDGPEVRPGMQSPFLRSGGLPRISAVLVTPHHLVAELSMRDWREMVDVPIGVVPVRALGLAMLTGLELPHEGLERIGREVWQAAEARWAEVSLGSRVPIEVEGPPPPR
jgi:hypothetical protein